MQSKDTLGWLTHRVKTNPLLFVLHLPHASFVWCPFLPCFCIHTEHLPVLLFYLTSSSLLMWEDCWALLSSFSPAHPGQPHAALVPGIMFFVFSLLAFKNKACPGWRGIATPPSVPLERHFPFSQGGCEQRQHQLCGYLPGAATGFLPKDGGRWCRSTSHVKLPSCFSLLGAGQ